MAAVLLAGPWQQIQEPGFDDNASDSHLRRAKVRPCVPSSLGPAFSSIRHIRSVLERYYRELLNFCARMVRDRDAAADVVQESYARVLAIQRTDAAIAEPRALLYQTARNIMVDQHRRDMLRAHEDLHALEESEQPATPLQLQPDALLASSQAVEAYVAAIEALPLRCREAFVLHVFDGLSHAQIAERMGASVSMVEKHIARARVACRATRMQLHGTSPAVEMPENR